MPWRAEVDLGLAVNWFLAPPDLPAAGLAPDLAGVNFALFAPVAGDSLAASSLRQSALRTVALLPVGVLSVLAVKAFVLLAGFDATPAALGALGFLAPLELGVGRV